MTQMPAVAGCVVLTNVCRHVSASHPLAGTSALMLAFSAHAPVSDEEHAASWVLVRAGHAAPPWQGAEAMARTAICVYVHAGYGHETTVEGVQGDHSETKQSIGAGSAH